MEKSTKKYLIWLLILTIVWPFIQVITFGIYQDTWALPRLIRSWPFLLMGLISGAVLLGLLRYTEVKRTRVYTVIAYIVGSPFAMFAGILVSNFTQSVVTPAIIGAIILIAFTLTGHFIAKKSPSTTD